MIAHCYSARSMSNNIHSVNDFIWIGNEYLCVSYRAFQIIMYLSIIMHVYMYLDRHSELICIQFITRREKLHEMF